MLSAMPPVPAPAPTPDDDATLVARCRQGDAGAWQALVMRYQRLVYAIVRRMGDDEHAAADVFQTVFSRLLQHLPRLTDPSRLQAWIVTTAKREALLQRRRAQRTVSMHREGDDGEAVPDWEAADDTDGPEQHLDDLQQLHAVRGALDRLDSRCRDLLGLLFTDSDERVPYEEVARRLGLPVGSIGPTRARCLGKLRALLE
ncbi:RNA polymerase sigma factor [Rubrivivax pictus]|uniref:RNA polymerase sigma factor n=2 Tax=Pseudaquabacterium pictum TaxID=2315236 RepID=A0A480ANC4_9BURK|nr:RNA polymerase sigma factor [Rubrivivax pictus]